MPRYYCDYCDAYLTHDSRSVRKQHCAGFKHKANVRAYYGVFLEKLQEHERQMQAQAYCQPIPQQPFMGAGAQHMRPWNGGVPPMGGGGYMPMNMNMNMNMNMQPMGRGRGGMTQGVQRGAMAPQHLRPPNHREGPPPTSMQQQPPHQQSSPQTQTQKPPQEEAAEKFLP